MDPLEFYFVFLVLSCLFLLLEVRLWSSARVIAVEPIVFFVPGNLKLIETN